MLVAGVLVLGLLRAQVKLAGVMARLWGQHQILAVLLQLILGQAAAGRGLIQLLRLEVLVALGS
jgi:hypothetical protein